MTLILPVYGAGSSTVSGSWGKVPTLCVLAVSNTLSLLCVCMACVGTTLCMLCNSVQCVCLIVRECALLYGRARSPHLVCVTGIQI